jgi:ADP-ribose pyrophosphatase
MGLATAYLGLGRDGAGTNPANTIDRQKTCVPTAAIAHDGSHPRMGVVGMAIIKRRWQQISVAKTFENGRISVFEDKVVQPDGTISSYTVIEDHADAVAIVAADSDGRVVLVRQHRYPIDATTIEVPSGEVAKGTNPIQQAHIELLEETGITAGRIEQLGYVTPWPARVRRHSLVVLATELDLSTVGPQGQDSNESIQDVILHDTGKILELIATGEVLDCTTLSALMLYWTRITAL